MDSIRLGTISCLFLILTICGSALAEDKITENGREVREITITHVNPEAPEIDGELDDEVWLTHEFDFARDFVQLSPDEGEAPTESTVVAVSYDEHALYVAFWCYDSEPEKIVSQLVRRDNWANADQVSLRLDPYHDHQSGYRFDLNVSGVLSDYRLYNDVDMDRSWDGIWEGATKLQPWGWSAEFKIPYSCIRFDAKEIATWGFAVTRYLPRRAENDWWAFSPSSEGGYVSTFGHLKGIQGIKPQRHIEILPYAVSRLETEPKSMGNTDGREFVGDVGVDMKFALASNFVVDATINPDFGQVELDRPVLNLTSFETFYEEKRPFFLEGSNLFNTPFSLFYSRRIGRSPTQYPDDADYYTDLPKATTILGAAKVTGKIGGNTSIALLNAVTQEETAEYVDQEGQNREAVVEPMADYSVLRIKRDVMSSSYVGLLATVAGQDTRSPEFTGGVDWRLYTSDGVWGVSGQCVTSATDYDDDAGFGIDVMFSKSAGSHVRGAFGFEAADPNLDLNALGFLSRNDYREAWAWLQYRTDDDWWIIRNTHHNINYWSEWNYDDARLSLGGNYNLSIQFLNNWWLSGGINKNAATWSDRETRGNGLWRRPSSLSWWASFSSDDGKKVSFVINPGSGSNRYGSWWANYVGLYWKPRSNIEISGGTNFEHTQEQMRWVSNEEHAQTGELIPVFARYNQDSWTPRITINTNLTRDISIQFSGRMLITGLNHRDYVRYVGNESYAPLNGLVSVDDLESQNDYNYRAFNSTMVLRWEYRSGSTLYVVWTQARSGIGDYDDVDFGRDFDELFSAMTGSDNAFLIKVNYWFNI